MREACDFACTSGTLLSGFSPRVEKSFVQEGRGRVGGRLGRRQGPQVVCCAAFPHIQAYQSFRRYF